jgi:murein DD-endopeptidase MepM/ murein hydrolase activator NlpD
MLRLSDFPVADGTEVSFHDGFTDPRHGVTHGGIDIHSYSVPGVAVACASGRATTRTTPRGGNIVALEIHQDGFVYEVLYTHLESYIGQFPRTVSPGDPIGIIGGTGDARGVVHLHFQVRRGARNENPYLELERLSMPTSGARRKPR